MCTIVHKKILIVHKKKCFMCTRAHIIFFRFYTLVQRPVETKEVHCTATYGRHKPEKFLWAVTRGQMTLSEDETSYLFHFSAGQN